MNFRRILVSILLVAFLFQLALPSSYATLAPAQGAQQGFSVSITNICGMGAPAAETIMILGVTLTFNGLPIASVLASPPISLTTGQTTTVQFPVSQFPPLATTTPNDLTIVWRRGEQQITTTFLPIEVGRAQQQSCLRVLLLSGLGGGDVGSVFTQVANLASAVGALFNVPINPDEAKTFKFGGSPMVMAPTPSLDFSTLGDIGVASLSGPLGPLPAGSYKMKLHEDGSGKLMLSFVDLSGKTQMTAPGEVKLLGPSSSTTITNIHELRKALSSLQAESATAKQGSADPCFFTIGLSLVFKPLPTIVLCLGFTCGPIFDSVFLSFSFCIDP